MTVQDIISMMNHRFPLHHQEKYDNAGEQVSFPEQPVTGILLALDIGEAVLAEAIRQGCNLIITHHPFIFKPVKNLVATDPRSSLLISLVERRISLYASHTNLDKSYYDRLPLALGLQGGEVLIETGTGDDGNPRGFGMLCTLESPITLQQLMELVKEKLGAEYLLHSPVTGSMIRTVAILNGSGGGVIDSLAQSGRADCIVTGDVGYHDMKTAVEYGITVIDAGHFGTERILLGFLKEDIKEMMGKNEAGNIPIFISGDEMNPFSVFR